jgi:8-oxo-dGTP pyrophosphatase MutT (NUDIX family)
MSKSPDRHVLPNRIRPRLSFDPKVQPWRVSDAEFCVIPAASLQPSFVRGVLSASIDRPLFLPDERSFAASEVIYPPTEAAVLVPLVMRAAGLTVLLTKRTDHLRDHAGQVSFPGGRVEAHDESPMATALRETLEETGLSPEHVDILGHLPRYFTGTGFAITPVTGLVKPDFTLTLDTFEVAQVFEVPLSHLTDHRNYRFHEATLPDGQIRRYYSVAWGGYFIWGATAAMLRGMYQVLAEAFSSNNRP